MAITDDILDETVRHSVYLERYKSRVVREILEMVKETEGKVQARLLKKELQDLPPREIGRLLKLIKLETDKGYDKVIRLLNQRVEEIAAYEALWQHRILQNIVPVQIDFIAPSEEQVIAAATSRPFAGKVLKGWFQDLPTKSFDQVRRTIRQGYVDGLTTQQVVRQIRGSRTQTGIVNMSRRSAETAVRTAIAHTANVARGEVYRRNRRVIKSVEWVATLDSRTTAVCRARDGKVYPVDTGPRPPAHAGCRSTTIPVLKSLRDLGIKVDEKDVASTRASMNGQVSSELNYDRWLRKQPVDFQDEVLGKSKAKLFRSGGVALDRFVDNSGREYTLAQLKQRESAAWAKSGL